jgi:uncharacterized protein YegJ (DUF2314 family)
MTSRTWLAALAALTLAVAAAPAAAQTREGDPVVDYAAKDAAMNAAIAEAQRTLPVFWRRQFGEARDGSEMVKVALPSDNGGREHIWVIEVQRSAAGYRGILDNEPRGLPGLSRGSEVTFTADMISDWAYGHKGRLWGGYTLRVMLPDLALDDAARLRAYLSDTPLEPSAR